MCGNDKYYYGIMDDDNYNSKFFSATELETFKLQSQITWKHLTNYFCNNKCLKINIDYNSFTFFVGSNLHIMKDYFK